MGERASKTVRLDPEQLDRAFRLVERHVREGRIPGAVLAIGDLGGEIRSEAYPPPDGPPLTTASRFLVASITKPVVATAVMQLVEEGLLVLHDPVQRYLPEFAPPPAAERSPGGEAVTTWHLLTHSAGLADTPLEMDAGTRASAEELYDLVCRRPLAFAPGTEYRYCSDSFFVLGRLIETLGGGRPYPDYLRERIFEPLGMPATSFEPGAADDPHRAPGFWEGLDGPLPQELIEGFAAMKHPGGGLWSTAPDLLRFGRAMLNGGSLDAARVLSRPFVELMTREQTAGIFEAGTPPRSPRYALGWGKSGLFGDRIGSPSQFDHGGATGTRLWVDPAFGLVAVFLMNRWGAEDHFSVAAIQAVYGALPD